MSYSIIYDKQFIKVSDNQFIPMVLSGCSNLYEFNGTKERRVRSWFPIQLENKIILSREEILNHLSLHRESFVERHADYDDKNYGWYSGLAINGTTRTTTFGKYKGIFITGMKKALNIETLKEEGINIYVKNNYTNDETLPKFSKLVSNSEELFNTIEEFNTIYNGKIGYTIECNLREDTPKRLRSKYFNKNMIVLG